MENVDTVTGFNVGVSIDELIGAEGFWYLASPYSKYPLGYEQAFVDVCKEAARLVELGVKIYCPIAHTHPIAVHGGLEPLNHKVWLEVDSVFMKAAHGLLVYMMPSWDESYGIDVEIRAFRKMGKPVWGLTCLHSFN